MERREFLNAGLAASAAAATLGAASGASAAPVAPAGKFRLKYAPSFKGFVNLGGKDPAEYIKFCADQGFRALFDNGMSQRPIAEQEQIAKEMARHDMTLGPFVASGLAPFVSRGKEVREANQASMKAAVEVSKRVNCKWLLAVPGNLELGLEPAYQTANVIDNCRYCCDILEESGLIMVLEPLNWWTNHPGKFLSKIPQAYLICEAVKHPCCKIVDDLYHQQITEGNIIPNIDMAWEHIASFHLGDNPGRKEPGTGEMNYKNIFKHIHEKGYEGVLCMEHGASKPGAEGEQAVIDAYRACDAF